ncbi:unnamed protein product [Linum trigynum]|uniref:Uncharacterized protein n=1 Tax=Linum trigynum TaxID=586398 RepID=A0AAV2DDX5_9ROSI
MSRYLNWIPCVLLFVLQDERRRISLNTIGHYQRPSGGESGGVPGIGVDGVTGGVGGTTTFMGAAPGAVPPDLQAFPKGFVKLSLAEIE